MKELIQMLKSKRFIAFVVMVIIYVTGVFFFDADEMNFALGLSALFTPYVISQGMRASKKVEQNNNSQL